MLVILAILLIDQLVILPLLCHLLRRNRLLSGYRSRCEDSRRYIGMLIETLYLYKHNPHRLYEHLTQQMTANTLLNHHIIDEDFTELFPSDFKARPNDMLLYKLHREGFTPRVLCVLFGLNNINSVYVKCHRIKRKIDPDKSPAPSAPSAGEP